MVSFSTLAEPVAYVFGHQIHLNSLFVCLRAKTGVIQDKNLDENVFGMYFRSIPNFFSSTNLPYETLAQTSQGRNNRHGHVGERDALFSMPERAETVIHARTEGFICMRAKASPSRGLF
jgi:hypothetical protein